jgi:hypothetical protein
MSNSTVKQLRELHNWMQNAAEATVDVTEKLHLVAIRKPFAALEKIDAIAGPVHLLDRAQNAVSRSVFRSLRAVNAFGANLAGRVIDQIESGAEKFTR